MDHEFEFHVVIKTTAGEYKSNKVTARTHKMENLTGIRVAFGTFEEPEPAITELKDLLSKMGASWSEEVSVETTHLLAQLPGGANYDRAVQHSIPIVKPEWLVQCDRNKKIQVSFLFYLYIYIISLICQIYSLLFHIILLAFLTMNNQRFHFIYTIIF